jgi:hypothetical protein
MAEAIRGLRLSGAISARNKLFAIIVAISGLAFFMEIAAGGNSIFYNKDLIFPILGGL